MTLNSKYKKWFADCLVFRNNNSNMHGKNMRNINATSNRIGITNSWHN